MVLEEATQSQRIGIQYPFDGYLPRVEQEIQVERLQARSGKKNLICVLVLEDFEAPYLASTTREPLLRASQAAMYVSLFIYPLFRCLAMCRLMYVFLYHSHFVAHTAPPCIHSVELIFTGRILSIQ
jgi:hypothetical protein